VYWGLNCIFFPCVCQIHVHQVLSSLSNHLVPFSELCNYLHNHLLFELMQLIIIWTLHHYLTDNSFCRWGDKLSTSLAYFWWVFFGLLVSGNMSILFALIYLPFQYVYLLQLKWRKDQVIKRLGIMHLLLLPSSSSFSFLFRYPEGLQANQATFLTGARSFSNPATLIKD